jgi:hypothetical protein
MEGNMNEFILGLVVGFMGVIAVLASMHLSSQADDLEPLDWDEVLENMKEVWESEIRHRT